MLKNHHYLAQLTAELNRTTTNITKDPEKFKDAANSMSFADAADLQKHLQEAKEAADTLKKELNKAFDFVRYTALPAVMEKNDIESGKVSGVGSVSLTTDLRASIPAAKKDEAFEWLDDHGFGDLIKPTVNSSTLKAWAKDQIKAGETLPEELFKTSVFTRASIRKG